MSNEIPQNALVKTFSCHGPDYTKCRFMGQAYDGSGRQVEYCQIVNFRERVNRLRSGEENKRETVHWGIALPYSGTLPDFYGDQLSLVADRSIDGPDDINPSAAGCPKGFTDSSAAQTLEQVRKELAQISRESH